MQQLFRKVFGIYPGEGAHALRFARLSLFWAFGSTCLDTLSDGLFLEKVGASQLPFTYLWIALGMIAVSSLVIYSLKVVSPYRILTIALTLGSFVCLAATFFVGGDPPLLFWYGLKIASKIFFAVMIAISWTFTDQYHDLQDAKRVYSIYSASYFFGAVLAGLSIHLFLESLGFSFLLCISALSIVAALSETKRIAYQSKAIHDDNSEGVFSGTRDSVASLAKHIFRSRFAVVLLLLSLVIQLLLTVTEFNYMQTFELAFRSGGDKAIASSLGKYRAWISLCNIIVGFFLPPRHGMDPTFYLSFKMNGIVF